MSNPYEEELEDRVIARALDAEETEAEAMDRALLDEYQQVLAHLPFDEIAPPDALEDRVIDAALERRAATVRSISRRRAVRWATLGAAVAAAAAVVTFMFTSTDDGTTTPGGRVELVGQARQGGVIGRIVNAPGTRQAELEANGAKVGEVALREDGEGVLYDIALPQPDANEKYWVWLVTDEKVVPIGVLPDPVANPNTAINTVPFTVVGDADAVKGVSISLEQGTSTPSTPSAGGVVASGTF